MIDLEIPPGFFPKLWDTILMIDPVDDREYHKIEKTVLIEFLM